MTKLRAFETRDALMQAAAARIAEALQNAVSERGSAVAALSGGATPSPAYASLAAMPLDWRRVTFLLVDERFVPTSDDASNEAMLRRALGPALGAGAKLLPMYAHNATPSEAATRADAAYANYPIDIALMGMGADGHTASWFPHSPDLNTALTSERTVIAVTAEGAAGASDRLTLTRAALAKAKAIVLLITGEEKRAIVEDQTRTRLPVEALPGPVETLWAP